MADDPPRQDRNSAPAGRRADILCIGAVLWDVIGRTPGPMHLGADVPGRISRQPGGVALNIAMTLCRFGLTPALLTAVGRDDDGRALLAACARMGMMTEHVFVSDHLPTDRYMAVEGANGLIAAIADARGLEAAGERILTPLRDGTFGQPERPHDGVIALDGNLTESLLAAIARDPAFASADLRVAPASPGKARRLLPLLGHSRLTLYVNREEAGLLCDSTFAGAEEAARALRARGVHRVLVTDGPHPCALADAAGLAIQLPPPTRAVQVTGAGDTFLAAHVAAELRGAGRMAALAAASQAAARHVSGEPPS